MFHLAEINDEYMILLDIAQAQYFYTAFERGTYIVIILKIIFYFDWFALVFIIAFLYNNFAC